MNELARVVNRAERAIFAVKHPLPVNNDIADGSPSYVETRQGRLTSQALVEKGLRFLAEIGDLT